MITVECIIARLEAEIAYYESPGSYEDDAYYIKCAAKAEICRELLDSIKNQLH